MEHFRLTCPPRAFAYRTTAALLPKFTFGTRFASDLISKLALSRRHSAETNLQGEYENNTLNTSHVTELLYQALETEKGGVQIYTTALRCAVNEDLKKEWSKYLEQTKEHVQVVSDILNGMNLDTEVATPGRKIVRHIGDSLVQAMEMALRGPEPCGRPDRRRGMRDPGGNQGSP